MADKKSVERRASNPRVERTPIDVANFLSRTGPLTVKPMQNIMFEMESTSSQGRTVLPETEQINSEDHTSSKVNVNHQVIDKASSKSQFQLLHRKIKYEFPAPKSLGSLTITQLEHDRVEVPKMEPKYNPGVLQGNWIAERMQPKYKPIHNPPLNTSNLRYRSTYKDAFLNHKLKDFPSVMMSKNKDKSLPPWLIQEDAHKTKPDKKSASNKQAKPKTDTRDGCGDKDPYKGHDMDPFKRRDQYQTGHEYKLDAFQEKPSIWDRYGGRDAYFKRKCRGNRISHVEIIENGVVNTGDLSNDADIKLAQDAPPQIQANHQPESGRTTSLQQVSNTGQGNANRYDERQAGGMYQRGSNQCVRLQPASDTNYLYNTNRYNTRQGSGMSPRGRPTDQYSTRKSSWMNQSGSYHNAKPQQAPDTNQMGKIRQIESDFAKMKLSTEYKNSFKATENIAATVASQRNERKLAAFAAARNVSTFAF